MTEKQADIYESLRDASISFPPYPVAGKSFFGLANVSLCLPIKFFLYIIANRHHICKVYRQCGENQALDKVAHRDRLDTEAEQNSVQHCMKPIVPLNELNPAINLN